MAKNKKNQAAAIRFGPALKALFICLLIAGSAVGYVWQKSQVYQLSKLIKQAESRLNQLESNNLKLVAQLAYLGSPVKLDQGARNLGLSPSQPGQVVLLAEMPSASSDPQNALRPIAARSARSAPQ